MRVCAPGKLLLSGAYSVLSGAPAIVAAVTRYAIADDSVVDTSPSREVAAAFRGSDAPSVNVDALYADAVPGSPRLKLGVGSSAAALVAAMGVARARGSVALDDMAVRRALFEEARDVHGRVQNGGSGVDVASSVFGGVLRYTLSESDGSAIVEPVSLPAGITVAVFFSGMSARTTDLRAHVDALKARAPEVHSDCFRALDAAARGASVAVQQGDSGAFVRAGQATYSALLELGRASGAPIVPESFERLAALAASEGAAFYPSGAGGGDVAVFLSVSPLPPRFADEAVRLGMTHLDVNVDTHGVHLAQTALAS